VEEIDVISRNGQRDAWSNNNSKVSKKFTNTISLKYKVVTVNSFSLID